MSREFKDNFVAYLDDVIEDVKAVKGTEEEMRKQLLEIGIDVVETIETRLNAEGISI